MSFVSCLHIPVQRFQQLRHFHQQQVLEYRTAQAANHHHKLELPGILWLSHWPWKQEQVWLRRLILINIHCKYIYDDLKCTELVCWAVVVISVHIWCFTSQWWRLQSGQPNLLIPKVKAVTKYLMPLSGACLLCTHYTSQVPISKPCTER